MNYLWLSSCYFIQLVGLGSFELVRGIIFVIIAEAVAVAIDLCFEYRNLIWISIDGLDLKNMAFFGKYTSGIPESYHFENLRASGCNLCMLDGFHIKIRLHFQICCDLCDVPLF